jgi:hypothetical protein
MVLLRLAVSGRATWTARGASFAAARGTTIHRISAQRAATTTPPATGITISVSAWPWVGSTIFARISRVTALESAHFSSGAGLEDRGRGKWFAPDTAAVPVLAFGRQGPRSFFFPPSVGESAFFLPLPLGRGPFFSLSPWGEGWGEGVFSGFSLASRPPSPCPSPQGERARCRKVLPHAQPIASERACHRGAFPLPAVDRPHGENDAPEFNIYSNLTKALDCNL